MLILVFTSVKIFPQNFGVESYDNAYRFYSLGDYNNAIKYYNEYLSSYSSDAQAYNERGRCYENLMQYDNALKDYSTALSLKPNFAQYYRDRGYVYLKTEKPDLALSDFNRTVLIDPDNAYNYSARALAYVDLGNFEFALKDINRAMQFEPSNPNYLITRTTIYSIMNDTLNFYKDLDTILTFNPVQFFSSFKLQDVLINYSNINKEIVSLTNIITSNSSDDFAYFERGFLYYITSRFEAALNDFENCKQCAGNKTRMIKFAERFIEKIKQYGDF